MSPLAFDSVVRMIAMMALSIAETPTAEPLAPLQRRRRNASARELDMIHRYKHGETLQEIGTHYRLTRERVRQILDRAGVKADEGGYHLKQFVRIANQSGDVAARLALKAAAYDMGIEEYQEFVAQHGSRTCSGPHLRFVYQKKSAKTRGIEWQLTFGQWWRIWQQSGHWAQRGRGKGYCMARWADSGPYSAENVYICTVGQNFSDSFIAKPWRVRWPNGHPCNSAKSHCKRGHPLSGENLQLVNGRNRVCKACAKARKADWQLKHRTVLAA